jgi:hypothetical protein
MKEETKKLARVQYAIIIGSLALFTTVATYLLS